MSVNILSSMVAAGFIGSEEIERIRESSRSQKLPVSDILRDEGIEDTTISYRLAEDFGYLYIDTEEELEIDTQTAETIGIDKCIKENFCPIMIDGEYTIVISCPDNEELMEFLQDKMQYTSFAVAPRDIIKGHNQRVLQPLLTTLISDGTGDDETSNSMEVMSINDENQTQAMSLISAIISAAKKQRASDIQIIPGIEDATIYFRIDGDRKKYSIMTKNSVPVVIRVLCNKANLSMSNDMMIQEGKVTIGYEDELLPVRMNVIPTRLGQTVNLRLLSSKVSTYETLGASDLLISQLKHIEDLTQGLVLIVGPTGSGKSTTMIALITRLLTHNINICSVEDPVEVIVPGVNQVDVGDNKNINFSTALKSFMRHDPDVISIGEIRDLDVAKTALQAANTGHLVISTIHTMDAVSAISRLRGLGVTASETVEGVVAIIAQRLVKRICPHCKTSKPMRADSKYRRDYDLDFLYPDTKDTLVEYSGVGCNYCENSGYYGRLVISECLLTTREFRHAIEHGASSDELRQLIAENGFVSMLTDGISKAVQGHTTFEQLYSIRQDSLLR